MNTQILLRLFVAAFAVCISAPGPAMTVAQTPPQDQRPSPPVYTTPAPSIGPSQTAIEQSATGATDQETIYGLQGVLVETLEGMTVSMQAADEALNPASAIKLATTLVALRTLGPQHRFITGVWATGTIERETGTINGNLYISGRDPSFHYEHAVMIASQLNRLGIRTVSGDLVVAPGFSMNFNGSALRSGAQLYDTLDSTLRSGEAVRSWMYERMALGDKESLETVPGVAIKGEVHINPVPQNARLLFSHKSSKLVDILKVLLCYSNNFMAERIGDAIGGKGAVRRQLLSSPGLAQNELRISSLSGLGLNRLSPRSMMKIFRALREELQKNKLALTDIMPVAGIDPGTLRDRFTDPPWRGSVVAKTGTLIRTDGGASALVGEMKTASGETLLFVIMNRRGNVLKFRENQDYLVMQIQNTRGGPKSFDYRPHTLMMKLADTESSFKSARDEYEPVLKGFTTSP